MPRYLRKIGQSPIQQDLYRIQQLIEQIHTGGAFPLTPAGHNGEVIGSDGTNFVWTAGGGGGNTIYTANDALVSNRIVDLNGKSLRFQQGGNDFLAINQGMFQSALNTEDGLGGYAYIDLRGNSAGTVRFELSSNDSISNGATIRGNGVTSAITYTADSHAFNGDFNAEVLTGGSFEITDAATNSLINLKTGSFDSYFSATDNTATCSLDLKADLAGNDVHFDLNAFDGTNQVGILGDAQAQTLTFSGTPLTVQFGGSAPYSTFSLPTEVSINNGTTSYLFVGTVFNESFIIGDGVSTPIVDFAMYSSTTAALNVGNGAVLIGMDAAAAAINLIAATNGLTLNTEVIPTVSSTNTFTNKRWVPRVGATASSATPTINTDDFDVYKLTALAADITSMTTNLSGTPNDGDILTIEFTGTATRAITWGAAFVDSTVVLPTTTSGTITLTVVLRYSTTSSYGANKWVCVNSF